MSVGLPLRIFFRKRGGGGGWRYLGSVHLFRRIQYFIQVVKVLWAVEPMFIYHQVHLIHNGSKGSPDIIQKEHMYH